MGDQTQSSAEATSLFEQRGRVQTHFALGALDVVKCKDDGQRPRFYITAQGLSKGCSDLVFRQVVHLYLTRFMGGHRLLCFPQS